MNSTTSNNAIYLKPFDITIDLSFLRSSLDVSTEAAIFCTYLVVYYICLKGAIILLRTLWRLKDDIYGLRRKLSPSADKVILITGGTSGIGLALAKYFYRRGFSIIVTRHSRPIPEELIEIQKCSSKVVINIDEPKMFFIHLDATSQESIAKSYDDVKEILTKNNLNLYALINNAGICNINQAIFMTQKQITTLNATNFLGPILMVRQYAPLLIKTPNSRIIHVGSAFGFFPIENVAVYCGTKAGTTLFMNSLALDLKIYNVKTIVVHVGDLIQNTSVLSNVEADIKRIYDNFSADEKEIYCHELKFNQDRAKSIQDWLDGTGKGLKSKMNIFERVFARFMKFFGGAINTGVELEDSYTMKSFDNAICFENPDKEMFSGNRMFTYFTGAVFSSLDSVERRAFGYLAYSLGAIEKLVTR